MANNEDNDPTQIVSSSADIQKNVKFGIGCYVHPGACIFAEAGEIVFGDFNIIEVIIRFPTNLLFYFKSFNFNRYSRFYN